MPITDTWTFYDPTGSSSFKGDHTHVTIHSGPKTDWWRIAPGPRPDDGADRRTGPIAYQTIRGQDWTLGAWLRQTGGDQYQQTTLFVAPHPPSSLTSQNGPPRWMKTGIENDGERFVGAVVSNTFSDWSVSHLTGDAASPEKDVYVSVRRAGNDLFVHYGLGKDTEKLIPLREVRSFGYGLEDEDWVVGVMVCGPLSESTSGEAYKITYTEGTAATSG